jgi:hypothetical protein
MAPTIEFCFDGRSQGDTRGDRDCQGLTSSRLEREEVAPGALVTPVSCSALLQRQAFCVGTDEALRERTRQAVEGTL